MYTRISQLHAKFSLKFPFKKVFLPSGLFLEKTKSTSELYTHISPFLEPYIDEDNAMKIGKVLALGFQKS